jgi:L-threonylcarbamoyladenylate synthase
VETRILKAFRSASTPQGEMPASAAARLEHLESAEIDHAAVSEAAETLKRGDVVAMPTETVYGLAANALDATAVARIYEAKGRPSNNPLIVHVASVEQAQELVEDWPPEAELLAEAFWPGPLTLVLKKRATVVPAITTAGGDTVALRCPSHPVALELIRKCGFPLAAPSANISNALSPTMATHVASSLGGRIPLILDGGPCTAGIESTVLNLSGAAPTILRPGVLTAHFLSEVLERRVLDVKHAKLQGASEPETDQALRSPGQLPTHYSPATPMFLAMPADLDRARADMAGRYKRLALLRLGGRRTADGEICMPTDAAAYATRLYAALHEVDQQNFDAILLESPPDTDEWGGVADRLGRAAKWWIQSPGPTAK